MRQAQFLSRNHRQKQPAAHRWASRVCRRRHRTWDAHAQDSFSLKQRSTTCMCARHTKVKASLPPIHRKRKLRQGQRKMKDRENKSKPEHDQQPYTNASCAASTLMQPYFLPQQVEAETVDTRPHTCTHFGQYHLDYLHTRTHLGQDHLNQVDGGCKEGPLLVHGAQQRGKRGTADVRHIEP
eukprot:192558-Pelagomonas_calceolata.AAC.1